jgi:hypothetical protein
MWDDFISRQIRRTNRNLLLLGVAMLAIIGAIVGATWRDVYNFVYGPFPIENSELAGIVNPDQPKHYFLKVRGEDLFSTGMQEVDAGNHQKVRAEIVALAVGNRLLLVKAPVGKHKLLYTGTLEAVPAQVQNGILSSEKKDPAAMKAPVLPFMLDATGFRTFHDSDNWLAASGGILIGGIGLFLAALAVCRTMQPDSHPLLAKLARYGSLQDVRMRIDSEMRSEGGGEQFGAMRITSNWLIQAAAYKTDVMASRDIIWAYPKVTKHYHSGIPTGTTHSAILRDSKGQSVEVSGKKESVPKLLESVQRRMPWVLLGFNKELEALWLKEKPKFLQLIEQRRAKLSPAMR